jgi:hypothetical protein
MTILRKARVVFIPSIIPFSAVFAYLRHFFVRIILVLPLSSSFQTTDTLKRNLLSLADCISIVSFGLGLPPAYVKSMGIRIGMWLISIHYPD